MAGTPSVTAYSPLVDVVVTNKSVQGNDRGKSLTKAMSSFALSLAVLVAALLATVNYPTETYGLPTHPVIVYTTQTLVNIVAITAVFVALRPAWRRRFGV